MKGRAMSQAQWLKSLREFQDRIDLERKRAQAADTLRGDWQRSFEQERANHERTHRELLAAKQVIRNVADAHRQTLLSYYDTLALLAPEPEPEREPQRRAERPK